MTAEPIGLIPRTLTKNLKLLVVTENYVIFLFLYNIC